MKRNRFVDILDGARLNGYAVAAFNILNGQTLRAVLRAAGEEGLPVILQTSVGTVRFLGVRALGGMVNAAREDCPVPFALHLDHCRDAAIAEACAQHGWDSVMMDYSHLPIEENARLTSDMVAFAHARNVAVEGEIGVIGGVEEEIVADAGKRAGYDETMRYIALSGIDAIAPAVGTAHGVYKSAPEINFELVEKLSKQPIPMVVHGGTGLEDDVFKRLVACGAAKINISTAVKLAYLSGMKKALESGAKNPLDADAIIENEVFLMARRVIRLFSGREADA